MVNKIEISWQIPGWGLFLSLVVWLAACDFGNEGGKEPPGKIDTGEVRYDTVFYASGKPRHITPYVDSLREGLGWSLFESGELEAIGYYKANAVYGWSMSFYLNGRTNYEFFVKEKKIVCAKQFAESGDLISHDPICLDEYYLDPTYSEWKKTLGSENP